MHIDISVSQVFPFVGLVFAFECFWFTMRVPESRNEVPKNFRENQIFFVNPAKPARRLNSASQRREKLKGGVPCNFDFPGKSLPKEFEK
jgi:hypothetical protein